MNETLNNHDESKLIELMYAEILHAIDSEALFKLSASEVLQEIENFVKQYCEVHRIKIAESHKKKIAISIKNDLLGFGPLEELLSDEAITEIMVNSHNRIYVEKYGRITKSELEFRTKDHLLNIAQRIAHQVNRRVDIASPMVDARLPDGSRVNIVLEPISLDGVAMTIRKFAKKPITIQKLIEISSISLDMANFLKICAISKVNMIVTGGTGSGKTTLLNIISGMIPENERVITIEDSAELQLSIPNLIRLESRLQNTEGKGEISIHDLIKNCLRMRPDRIVIGEVRGPETFEMLKALNTGHDGSLSTIHSNSAEECLLRLENMVATYNPGIPSTTIRAQIVSAVDAIVHIKRLRDGTRRVVEILDVTDLKNDRIITNSLFQFIPKSVDQDNLIVGEYTPMGHTPSFYEKILVNDLLPEMRKALHLEQDSYDETL